MNVARPITKEEYAAFRQELYNFHDGAETTCRFAVPLDEDPTLQPKKLPEKIAKTQAGKDRVIVILNRGILNESYWKNIVKRVDSRLESEIARAYMDPSMKELKNQELRQGNATVISEGVVLATLFGGKGTYDEQMALIHRNAQDAIAFLAEVKNIFDNLDSTSMALAVQLKGVIVNNKVYGEHSGELEPSVRQFGGPR